MSNIDVSSIEIRDFAQSLGWMLIPEALKDGLFVLNSPSRDGTQLCFPTDPSAPEYNEMAEISLQRLSESARRPVIQLVEDIREVNDDVISLRYFSQNKIVNALSFEEAFETIGATRQMLLSAASSVVNPTVYHPKLNRIEPQELIKKAKFRHTQGGSFILKIAIPFEPSIPLNDLFSNLPDNPLEKSFGRKTVELISTSSKEILDAIESNTIPQLYKSQVEHKKPILSYNFCDSLSKMFDEEREIPFEFIFNWSRASMLIAPVPHVPTRVTFPFAYINKIKELKEYFTPKKPEISDTFIGTVEELNGEIGLDGRRSGEVILNVLVENDIIKTKANLTVEQYQQAIKAHATGGAYVVVKGKLHMHARFAKLDELNDFKIAER